MTERRRGGDEKKMERRDDKVNAPRAITIAIAMMTQGERRTLCSFCLLLAVMVISVPKWGSVCVCPSLYLFFHVIVIIVCSLCPGLFLFPCDLTGQLSSKLLFVVNSLVCSLVDSSLDPFSLTLFQRIEPKSECVRSQWKRRCHQQNPLIPLFLSLAPTREVSHGRKLWLLSSSHLCVKEEVTPDSRKSPSSPYKRKRSFDDSPLSSESPSPSLILTSLTFPLPVCCCFCCSFISFSR